MNRFYFLLLLIGFTAVTRVQAQYKPEKCLAQQILHKHQAQNKQHYQNLEKQVQNWISKYKAQKSDNAIITIPVVFHVVYNPTQNGSNLSKAQLQSQIDVLNEDFRRQNADAQFTRDIFKDKAADFQIEFAMAKRDPEGKPTDGITRTESYKNFNVFAFENDVKYAESGGHDAWPADQYLNIWTCDMSLVAAQYVIGYAQFPGGNPETDGIVIQWQYVGRPGTSGTLGRTATHEVGHWLGLRHIWGDGDCSATDFVDDTPQAAQSNSGCPVINSCSNETAIWQGVDPPDMVENYMDYTNDACMNAFTEGQKLRALGFLYNDPMRFALFSSKGAQEPEGTGLTKQAARPEINLFPNPTSNKLWIDTQEDTEIRVYDLFGRQVQFKASFSETMYTLELSQLPKGVYLVELSDKQGNRQVSRLIKE